MILIASWVHRNTPVKLVATTACHLSSGISSIGIAGAPMPALLNKQIEPAVGLFGLGEQRLDRGRIGDVGRHRQRFARRLRAFLGDRFEHVLAPAGEHHGVAFAHQAQRHRPADAGAGSRHQCNFSRGHRSPPLHVAGSRSQPGYARGAMLATGARERLGAQLAIATSRSGLPTRWSSGEASRSVKSRGGAGRPKR